MKKKILFVCRANRGRSPFAECALKKVLKGAKGIKVSSAGIEAIEGKKMPSVVIEASKKLKLEFSKRRAKFLTRKRANESDEIYVFENLHKRQIESKFPKTKGKVHILKEIKDLKGTPVEHHIKHFKEIKKAVEKLAKKRGWI